MIAGHGLGFRGEQRLAEDGFCLRPIRKGIRTGVAQDAVISLLGDEDLAGDGIDNDGNGVIERRGIRRKGREPRGEIGLAEDEAGLSEIRDGFAEGGGGGEGESCEEEGGGLTCG